MSVISIHRCRRLLDDLRRSPDEKQDRAILREFARELDRIETLNLERPEPDELRRCSEPEVRFPGQLKFSSP